MRPMASASAAIGIGARRAAGARGFGTRSVISQLSLRSQQQARARNVLSRQSLIFAHSKRGYADRPVVKEKTKKRGRGFLRWTWRITYLSALGGLAFMSWSIYDQKYPEDQAMPDPNAKTLVVLGMEKPYSMEK